MNAGNGEHFDVVVAGGGPGGSTLAAVVAMRGHRVLVLESEEFPRYQIGESLLPATIHGICRLTGAADEVARAGFMRKGGGTFKWGANPDPWTFSFSMAPGMAGPSSFAYQVERTKFDKILLDNARRVGAEVREQCTATSVLDEDGRAAGVWYSDADGGEHLVRARYVVDASGHKSRIYRSVGGSRKYSDFFRNIALFGYFENGKRLPEPNSGNILCAAFDNGWFWYIPLSPTMTSVGAVVHQELASKIQGDPDGMLQKLIEECPLIADYLAGARRITDGEYGRTRVRKDYSYYQTKFWRPGLVLIGDAACFVDPVFSSGVHLATYSALLAGRSINSSIEGIAGEETAFREFEARYRREYGVFYEFLVSFYEMHASENSYFWEARKIIKSSDSELEAFVSLVGGLSSGEFVLRDSEAVANRFSSASTEFGQAVQQLVDGGTGSMVPLFKSSIVRRTMQESARIQARAGLGAELEPERPLFADGMISSTDGLLWVTPEQISWQPS
jgi:FAD-dependent halogenase